MTKSERIKELEEERDCLIQRTGDLTFLVLGVSRLLSSNDASSEEYRLMLRVFAKQIARFAESVACITKYDPFYKHELGEFDWIFNHCNLERANKIMDILERA